MRLARLAVTQTGSAMLYNGRFKQLICSYFGVLLFLVGLHQAEGAATEMASLNWKPFVYGGMASIVAEFGESVHLLFLHHHHLLQITLVIKGCIEHVLLHVNISNGVP